MCAKKCKSGFTIVELLISLAITAILLTAIAVAFNASAENYEANKSISNTINTARQALYRMTNQLRTAYAVDSSGGDAVCTFRRYDGDTGLTYSYDSSADMVYVIDVSSSQAYKLCENVTAMSFSKNTALVDGVTVVKSVQISMTVSDGSATQNLAAAAVIRKNLD